MQDGPILEPPQVTQSSPPAYNVKNFVLPSRDEINKRYSFDPAYWIDCGGYWLNTALQGSSEWELNRKLRLTASNFGAALGLSTHSSIMDVAMDITNVKSKSFPDRGKLSKQHGIVMEPEARAWYCQSRKVKVEEVGLAVPKWEPRIGASLDGEVVGTEGMIEIKSPLQMYDPLDDHMAKIKTGWRPPQFYHAHIWDTHYAQIQGGMKITGKQWCDYIVYATQSNRVYVERIPFNQQYWDETLWPGIQQFLDNYMEPLIADGFQSHLFHAVHVAQ